MLDDNVRIFFLLQLILKQFTQDYLSNYMIGGRPSQGVGLESCMPSCDAPDSMRQVSSSYSPSLPCHLLACCIFSSCAYMFVSCIRAFYPLSVLQSDTPMSPGAPFCLFSCAGVKLSRNGLRFAKRPWYTTGRLPVKFRAISRTFKCHSRHEVCEGQRGKRPDASFENMRVQCR